MGERAGYRVVEIVKGKRHESWIARKQWYLGGSKAELEGWVGDIAKVLMNTGFSTITGKATLINGGEIALRHDLDIGRLFHALIKATLGDGFESLNPTIKCDIDDHGLYEVELVKWNKWAINHYETSRKKNAVEFEKEMAAAVKANKEPEKKPYVSEYVWGELQPKRRLGMVEFVADKTLEDGVIFKWNKNFKEY